MLATGPVRRESPERPSNLEGIRVLIVEDEEDARDIISRSMREFGAQVTPVSSAAEALAFLDGCATPELPHVVVTDIGMPDQDGYSLLEQIRRLPPEHGGGLPAVAVTAYAGPADRQRVLAAGFKLHIEKPVAPLALAAAVARVASGTV